MLGHGPTLLFETRSYIAKACSKFSGRLRLAMNTCSLVSISKVLSLLECVLMPGQSSSFYLSTRVLVGEEKHIFHPSQGLSHNRYLQRKRLTKKS